MAIQATHTAHFNKSLCFYAFYHVSCLDLHPYMLICLDLHALGFMPYFPMFCASFCSRLTLGYMLICLYDIVGYALLGSMYFICLFPCYMVRSLSSHAYMLGSMFFHVCVKFLHVHMRVSMPICLDLCFYVLVCLNLCFLHVLCHLPCAWALHAMFVRLDLGYVCHAMCYCGPFVALSFFLVFWPIGLDLI